MSTVANTERAARAALETKEHEDHPRKQKTGRGTPQQSAARHMQGWLQPSATHAHSRRQWKQQVCEGDGGVVQPFVNAFLIQDIFKATGSII